MFGKTLRLLRIQKGIQQKRIALSLGVDQSFLSRVEAGRTFPPRSSDFIARVSQELGLTDAERKNLQHEADAERSLGSFARQASREQAMLGLEILNKLNSLNQAKIDAISAILRL